MPLTATAIGAFPKPDYVKLPDWFADMGASNPTVGWSEALAKMGDEAQGIIKRGVGEAVCAQVAAGVDIPTDGEIARENYIHYHCRHLVGVDFEKRTEKKARIGNYCALLPTVCGAVSPRELFLADDWRCAQQATDKPVKITMPGPLTLAGTVVDEFYGDLESLGKAIAAALNAEVISLAKAGCKHIQIDEPLLPANRKTPWLLAWKTWNAPFTAARHRLCAPFMFAVVIPIAWMQKIIRKRPWNPTFKLPMPWKTPPLRQFHWKTHTATTI